MKKKSYFSYLNKLVNKYNNTYHCSIVEKPVNADCSSLSEKNWDKSRQLRQYHLNLKLVIDSELLCTRIF